MKSKASIKGHPLHPILIAFPIAFFAGTLLFDLLAMVKNDIDFRRTASYLEAAGIIGGLAAAIPGIVDYFFVVPPKSSAHKRATTHGLLNVTMIILFTIAYFYRKNTNAREEIVIALEAAGVILLSVSGWMGGTLVYKNQIAVVNRYADSGKWKEERFPTKTGSIEVGNTSEMKRDQMKLVHVGNKRIVVAKTEQGFVAFDDHCTHKGGSLAAGMMICGTVQCPWHGSQFDVNTGKVKAGPAEEGIVTYAIREENGKLFLAI